MQDVKNKLSNFQDFLRFRNRLTLKYQRFSFQQRRSQSLVRKPITLRYS